MSPQRIQLRRAKGWRKPEGAVVVSRPSRWGNPFTIGWCCRVECGITLRAKHWHVYDTRFGDDQELTTTLTVEDARAFAVSRFRRHAFRRWDLTPLRGRDLACWCPLDQPCHADVLLEIANRAAS